MRARLYFPVCDLERATMDGLTHLFDHGPRRLARVPGQDRADWAALSDHLVGESLHRKQLSSRMTTL